MVTRPGLTVAAAACVYTRDLTEVSTTVWMDTFCLPVKMSKGHGGTQVRNELPQHQTNACYVPVVVVDVAGSPYPGRVCGISTGPRGDERSSRGSTIVSSVSRPELSTDRQVWPPSYNADSWVMRIG
jgi:hypothetical protein